MSRAIPIAVALTNCLLTTACARAPLATMAADQAAKKFLPQNEVAVVYVQRKWIPFYRQFGDYLVAFDGKELGGLRIGDFFRIEAAPGRHVVGIYQGGGSILVGVARPPLTFTARAGEIIYLLADSHGEIGLQDPVEGRDRLAGGDLLVAAVERFDAREGSGGGGAAAAVPGAQPDGTMAFDFVIDNSMLYNFEGENAPLHAAVLEFLFNRPELPLNEDNHDPARLTYHRELARAAAPMINTYLRDDGLAHLIDRENGYRWVLFSCKAASLVIIQVMISGGSANVNRYGYDLRNVPNAFNPDGELDLETVNRHARVMADRY